MKSNDIAFSLCYSGADAKTQDNKYVLYLEAAKFADANGFEAVWTPERHFDEAGGLFPNPSVLSAALAPITRQVKLRAGSIVLPLHNAVRVAEEWAVVDNLSHGRAGIAVAPEWDPRDFVFFPDRYARRIEAMKEGVRILETLWSGGRVTLKDGAGKDSEVEVFPKPLQTRLPLWIAARETPELFAEAGQRGAHVLTLLVVQSMDTLRRHIGLYRDALTQHGHDPNAGRVTVVVPTYLGEDLDKTTQAAREPFLNYLRAHPQLVDAFTQSLAADERPPQKDLHQVVSFAFERYARRATLVGTPQSCLDAVRQLKEAGVNEIACLMDWVDAGAALDGLHPLRKLKELAAGA